MGYNQLVRNWHHKSSEEDYFSKFVFEYLAFIAYLKTEKYVPNDPTKTFKDREVIQKLKQDKKIETDYLRKINEKNIIQSYWEELKTELETRPLVNVSTNPMNAVEIKWWNCSHDDLQKKTEDEEKLQCGILQSLNNWENMVEFWYSIRNNLFHGAKDPEGERDQKFVRIGYLTLSPLMEILLYPIQNVYGH